MNADLERDLAGTNLESFVSSLRSAPQAQVPEGFSSAVLARIRSRRSLWLCPRAWLPLAAALAAAFVLTAFLLRRPLSPSPAKGRLSSSQRPDGSFSSSSSAPYVQAFAVTVLARDPVVNAAALDAAVGVLIRSQTAEGGWANKFLSVRNTAALAVATNAGVARARIAYRKGLRYLRINGIDEMSARDLAQEAKLVAARLGMSNDAGLADSASLCAARL